MAKSAVRELVVRIKGEDQVTQVFGKIDGATGKLKVGFAGLRKGLDGTAKAFAATSVAGGAFLAFATKAVKASAAQEAINAQLENSLARLGIKYSDVRGEIDAFAETQQRTTQFGDDQTKSVLRLLIDLTGDYKVALASVSAVQDLAVAQNMSVDETTRLVGRALEGNVAVLGEHLSALRGMKEETSAALTPMERMELVTGAISAKFGGSATAIDATSLAMARLNNRAGDVVEAFGDALTKGDGFAGVILDLETGLIGLEGYIKDNANTIRTVFVGSLIPAIRTGQAFGFVAKGLTQTIQTLVGIAGPAATLYKEMFKPGGGLLFNFSGVMEAVGGVETALNQTFDSVNATEEVWLKVSTALDEAIDSLREWNATPVDDKAPGAGRLPGRRPPGRRLPGAGPGAGDGDGVSPITLDPETLDVTGLPLVFDQEEFGPGRQIPIESFDEMNARVAKEIADLEAEYSGVVPTMTETSAVMDVLSQSASNLGSALGTAATDVDAAAQQMSASIIQMIASLAAAQIGGPAGIAAGGFLSAVLGGAMSASVGGRRQGARGGRAARSARRSGMARSRRGGPSGAAIALSGVERGLQWATGG